MENLKRDNAKLWSRVRLVSGVSLNVLALLVLVLVYIRNGHRSWYSLPPAAGLIVSVGALLTPLECSNASVLLLATYTIANFTRLLEEGGEPADNSDDNEWKTAWAVTFVVGCVLTTLSLLWSWVVLMKHLVLPSQPEPPSSTWRQSTWSGVACVLLFLAAFVVGNVSDYNDGPVDKDIGLYFDLVLVVFGALGCGLTVSLVALLSNSGHSANKYRVVGTDSI